MILWDANRHLFVKILFSSIWMKIYTCLLVYGKRPFEKKNETDDHWCLEVKLNVCILNCKSDRDEKYWDCTESNAIDLNERVTWSIILD